MVGIAVKAEKQFATYQQVVEPGPNPESTLADLFRKMAETNFTGKLIVNLSQGGCTNIITEQVAKIKLGGDVDKLLETEFGK
jgi:hypothetical protein